MNLATTGKPGQLRGTVRYPGRIVPSWRHQVKAARQLGCIRAGLCLLLAILILVLSAPASARELRHEVGLRMRPFEQTWNTSTPAAKQRALPHLERAVQAFFAFDLAAVARHFDEARQHLLGNAGPARWCDPVSAQPVVRVLEPGQRPALRIVRLYRTTAAWPASGALVVHAVCGAQRMEPARLELPAPPATPPVAVAEELVWALPWDLAPGDWALELVLHEDEQRVRSWTDLISVLVAPREHVAGLEHRLRTLPIEEARVPLADTRRATASALLRRVEQVLDGAVPELPCAAQAALARVEDLMTQLTAEPSSSGVVPRTGLGSGDQWWVIAHGDKRTTTRFWIPAPPSEPDADRPPLVIAVHGVGGSENLFFDGYGAGRIVELCRQRGWMLAAPARPLLGGAPLEHWLATLADLLPFDPQRVYLVGHSRGASECVDLLQRAPGRFRAAALLGGGGRVRPAGSSALAGVRIFVAAGERDFARTRAARLHASLAAAGASSHWTVVPHTEHMTVVADALPAAFEFLAAPPD